MLNQIRAATNSMYACSVSTLLQSCMPPSSLEKLQILIEHLWKTKPVCAQKKKKKQTCLFSQILLQCMTRYEKRDHLG